MPTTTQHYGIPIPIKGETNWTETFSTALVDIDADLYGVATSAAALAGLPASSVKGAWSSTVTYAVSDVVIGSNGLIYLALISTTNSNPTTSGNTNWTQILGTGAVGLSAYQVAVANGYSGTQTQWLASLVGPTGANGQVTYDFMEEYFDGTGEIGEVVNGLANQSYNFPISSQVFAIPETFTKSGSLESISAIFYDAPPSSTIDVIIMNSDMVNFTITDQFTITPSIVSPGTVQTFVAGTDYASRSVTAGQYIGVIAKNNSHLTFNSNATTPGYYAYVGATTIGTSYVWLVTPANATPPLGSISLAATVHYASTGGSEDAVIRESTIGAALIPALSTYSPSNLNSSKTKLWSENFTGTSLPTNWTIGSGTWTVSNALLSPTSGQGYTNYVYFAQQYSIGKRTNRIIFETLASGTILGFGSVENGQESSNTILQSLIVVDGSANTLAICNAGYNGTGNPGSIVTPIALGFSITTGSKYVLTVTINERQMNATLFDPITGILASVSYGNNATDASVNASTPAGILSEYPTFVAIAGQFKIDSIEILADTSHSRALFLGDSITWGSYVKVADRWASLIASQIGASAIVSGRPGGTSYGVLERVTTELQYIRPDYLIVMIGTNDSFTYTTAQYEANLTSIISIAQSYGCQVIVCTLIPNADSTIQTTLNTYNTFIKALTGVTIVRADLAMSTGNDGVTRNTSLYADVTHPNALGGIAIAKYFQGATSFLFD